MRAIKDLWEQHSLAVKGFFIKRVNDLEMVEDLRQTVFLKLCRSEASLTKVSDAKAWVFRVAINVLNDHFRQKRTKRGSEISISNELMDNSLKNSTKLPFPAPHDSEAADLKDDPSCGEVACGNVFEKNLSTEEVSLINRFEFRREKLSDISKEKNLNLATIKSKIQRARKKIKKNIVNSCCFLEFAEEGSSFTLSPSSSCAAQKRLCYRSHLNATS